MRFAKWDFKALRWKSLDSRNDQPLTPLFAQFGSFKVGAPHIDTRFQDNISRREGGRSPYCPPAGRRGIAIARTGMERKIVVYSFVCSFPRLKTWDKIEKRPIKEPLFVISF